MASVAPEISVIDTLDRTSLKEEWAKLVAATQEPSVFLSWDWMDLWRQMQPRNVVPHLIAARVDGRLAALAPLVSVSRTLGPWAVRTLEFMGTGVGADHLTFLAIRDRSEPLIALMRWLAEHCIEWDLVDLARADSALARLFMTECSHDRRFRLVAVPSDVSPVLQLPSSWPALAASLNNDLPARVGYYHRRLARDFRSVEFQQVDETSFDVAWSDLVRLHTRRWAARGLGGAFGDGTFERFHRQFARRALQYGWLRLHRLEIDGRGVAVLYALQMHERVSYVQGGFDPAMRRYSVGTLLLAHAIRRAIEDKARVFDFLRGAEPYKMRWASSTRQDYHLLLVPKRPRSMMTLAWSQRFALAQRLRAFAGRAETPRPHFRDRVIEGS